MIEYGRQARSARIQQGLSKAELARQAGLSEKTLSSVEEGKDVSTTTLRAVSKALGIEPVIALEDGCHSCAYRAGCDQSTDSGWCDRWANTFPSEGAE